MVGDLLGPGFLRPRAEYWRRSTIGLGRGFVSAFGSDLSWGINRMNLLNNHLMLSIRTTFLPSLSIRNLHFLLIKQLPSSICLRNPQFGFLRTLFACPISSGFTLCHFSSHFV